jgi:hypothetical protein
VLGVAAGGFIVLVNAQTMLESWFGMDETSATGWFIVGALALVWVSLIASAVASERASKRAGATPEIAGDAISA